MTDTRTNDATRQPTAVDEAMRLLNFIARHFCGASDSTQTPRASSSISYLRLKLDLAEPGSVDLELSQQAEQVVSRAIAPASRPLSAQFFSAVQSTLPCQPANDTAAKIMQTCDDVFDANRDDCNHFVKAASTPYFGDVFDGLDADGIIAALNASPNGWASTQSIPDAINNAQNGLFVIAGMTSTELDQDHGHLAVVVGCPGALSGTVNVPIGYAGSIGSASAQIRGARLSGSFPASSVRSSKVTYFSKTPTQ